MTKGLSRVPHRLQKLDALSTAWRDRTTVADMQDVQATSMSSLGEATRTPIVASLGRSIASGSYDTATTAFLTDVSNRLTAWTLATPPGTGTTDSGVIADSIATTIFNVGITRMIALAFNDERQHFANGSLQVCKRRLVDSRARTRRLCSSVRCLRHRRPIPRTTRRAS